MRLISALLLTSSLLIAGEAAAQARIFCCDDAKGRKVCADFVPPECASRAYEERDSQGRVSKKYDAPLTAEQQARRATELAKAEAEKRKAVEERRRALALVSNYANEKEIDSARDRALAVIEKNLKQTQAKLDEANKDKKKLDSEKEFYKKKPLPEQTKILIRDNESEIRAQQAAVEAQTKEMNEIRARFAEEKKRYLELTGKKTAEEAAPAEKSIPAPGEPADAKK